VPFESRYVRIVPGDNVDDSKVLEGVNILPEITSNVEDTLVDSSTPIIDKVHVFFDSITDDIDVIVESNIPAVPSKSFEFFCVLIMCL